MDEVNHSIAMAMACMFMVIMSIIAGCAVNDTHEKYNNPHLWKGQSMLCKFWMLLFLACFLPIFFKAFLLLVLW